jgi:hypothetical protein
MATEKKEQKKEAEKQYKCPWGCGKSSKYKADMVKHEQKCPKRPVAYKEG